MKTHQLMVLPKAFSFTKLNPSCKTPLAPLGVSKYFIGASKELKKNY